MIHVPNAILEYLVPGGKGLAHESELWDYKEKVPDWNNLKSLDKAEKDNFKAKLCEILKDCMAFYNSYGGFIVFGIADDSRLPVPAVGQLDIDELKKQFKTYSGVYADITLQTHSIPTATQTIDVPILCVPKRPYDQLPVQAQKGAPINEHGKQPFKKGDVYVRREAESRPMADVDDMAFLFNKNSRDQFSLEHYSLSTSLPNNLPPRDPGLLQFVGRQYFIDRLSRWLADSFDNLKMLVGVGGVGKTAIARQFAELLITNSPPKYENLVWLSAKPEFFVSLNNDYVKNKRIDFDDATSCLTRAILEMGLYESELEPGCDTDELITLLHETTKTLPTILIVDDIDSLDIDSQYQLFDALREFATLSQHGSEVPSKILITSRLDLSAAPSTTVPISGMNESDFQEYVLMVANGIGIDTSKLSESRLCKLYEVSEGSPAFANAIIRLMSLGETFDYAISEWKGPDGEQIRRFAFKRELERLSKESAGVLYSACLLMSPTNSSLQEALGISRTATRDAIAKLRQFHLVSQRESTGDYEYSTLIVPENIKLMSDLIRESVHRPEDIERRATMANQQVQKLGANRSTGKVMSEVTALWRQNKLTQALEVISGALEQKENDPKLLSMLARSYLKVVPPNTEKAEHFFNKAYKHGNRNQQTLEDWIQCRIQRGDWRGLTQLAAQLEPSIGSAQSAYYRAFGTAKMAENRQRERNITDANTKYREAARIVRDTLQSNKGKGKVHDLIELQKTCYQNHVALADRLVKDEAELKQVWDACYEAYKAKVRGLEIIQIGLDRLHRWVETSIDQSYSFERQDMMAYRIEQAHQVVQEMADNAFSYEKMLQKVKNLERMLSRYQGKNSS